MSREAFKKAVAALALMAIVAVPVVAWATGTPAGFAHSGHPGNEAPMGGMHEMGSMMTGMPGVESEFDYLAQMIPHHEEAIASAQVVLEGTDRPEMEAFAENIIETQSSEVSQMREWLATWYPTQDITVEYKPMMRDLEGLSGDELDQAFLEDMIGHHMGAVMMSQQLLAGDLAEHPEVAPFAEQIRDNQHAEIFQMRSWYQEWFGVSPVPARGARH